MSATVPNSGPDSVTAAVDALNTLALAVARHHREAIRALARRDMPAMHAAAAEYHCAASAHDAITGGNIRAQYDGRR